MITIYIYIYICIRIIVGSIITITITCIHLFQDVLRLHEQPNTAPNLFQRGLNMASMKVGCLALCSRATRLFQDVRASWRHLRR